MAMVVEEEEVGIIGRGGIEVCFFLGLSELSLGWVR